MPIRVSIPGENEEPSVFVIRSEVAAIDIIAQLLRNQTCEKSSDGSCPYRSFGRSHRVRPDPWYGTLQVRALQVRALKVRASKLLFNYLFVNFHMRPLSICQMLSCGRPCERIPQGYDGELRSTLTVARFRAQKPTFMIKAALFHSSSGGHVLEIGVGAYCHIVRFLTVALIRDSARAESSVSGRYPDRCPDRDRVGRRRDSCCVSRARVRPAYGGAGLREALRRGAPHR